MNISNIWKLYQGALIPNLPPHVNVNLNEEFAAELLKSKKAFFIRWTTDFDVNCQLPFWYVIKDEKEDTSLRRYNTKIRSEIRRGLRNTKVEKIDNIGENIVENLYSIYLSAFERYKNVYLKPVSFDFFKKELITYNAGDVWLVKNKAEIPIAYALTKIDSYEGTVVGYNVIKLNPRYLKLYPSYALVFEYYLNEKNVLYVHDGSRNLGHDTNIHNWLIRKFKFRKAYARLHIVYRKDIELLVKSLYPLKDSIYRLASFNSYLKKLAVLLKHEEIRRGCELAYKNCKE